MNTNNLINEIDESTIEIKVSDLKRYIYDAINKHDDSLIKNNNIKYKYSNNGTNPLWKVFWNEYKTDISYNDCFVNANDIDELLKYKIIDKLDSNSPVSYKYFCGKHLSKFKELIENEYSIKIDSIKLNNRLFTVKVKSNNKIYKTKSITFLVKENDNYLGVVFDIYGNIIKDDGGYYYIYKENAYNNLKYDVEKFINDINKQYNLV